MSSETRTSSVTGQIADTCTVLVVGGGPGGSYAAAALAREGIDIVLLEADVFPRYHIGESMLASLRHLLRFIDLDSTFDEYGFTKKVGAAFKMNGHKRHGYTDFLAAGGPDNYAWNVVRADADDLMFRHAGKCGAKIFDGVKVSSVAFSTDAEPPDSNARPISARWTRSSDGTSGEIKFRYIIDASGRAGLLCTKYLKNRMYNQGLKNVASWGYWKGAGAYAAGTARANSPFFEALVDESGWAWLIPLHNGKTSVGIVMNQEISSTKRNSRSPVPSAREFYLEQLKLAPELLELLGDAELASPPDDGPQVKSASDYSYSASSYAAPGLRVVGDAGCFIDPFFSSGVHLALTGALSAAATICAVLRGECSEGQAVKWHSNKVGTSYTRFLVVVLSAYKQMRAQDAPVLADFDEDNFDRAFAFFRPIIQGTADVNLGERLSQAELAKTLDFCSHAFEPTLPEEHEAVFSKLNGTGHEGVPLSGSLASNHQTTSEPPANTHLVAAKSSKMDTPGAMTAYNTNLTAAEQAVLTTINARKVLRFEDTITVESFETDTIDGLRPRLECGRLGLISA